MQLRDAFCSLLGEDQFRNIALQLQFGVSQDTLTDFERMAIWVYTTAFEYHHAINRSLWGGEIEPELRAIIRCLESAMLKLPKFDGYVYRGIDLSRSIQSRYIVGSDMTWPGFSSATSLPDQAFTGNTLFTVRSFTGRMLGIYSSQYHESEVLFPPGSQFKVLAVEQRKDGVAIALREIE